MRKKRITADKRLRKKNEQKESIWRRTLLAKVLGSATTWYVWACPGERKEWWAYKKQQTKKRNMRCYDFVIVYWWRCHTSYVWRPDEGKDTPSRTEQKQTTNKRANKRRYHFVKAYWWRYHTSYVWRPDEGKNTTSRQEIMEATHKERE